MEYEKKMQKMAAELALAQASGERTAAEMERLKAEADAKQRALCADHAARVESQRAQLQQQFDAEMARVQHELETTRRSRQMFQASVPRGNKRASIARDDPSPLPGMHCDHNALPSQTDGQTDRRTLTS